MTQTEQTEKVLDALRKSHPTLVAEAEARANSTSTGATPPPAAPSPKHVRDMKPHEVREAAKAAGIKRSGLDALGR